MCDRYEDLIAREKLIPVKGKEKKKGTEKEREFSDDRNVMPSDHCSLALRKLFFFQNYHSRRTVVLHKLIRRPLFPPSLIECRGETSDTKLSFESSLLGFRVVSLRRFPSSLFLIFFPILFYSLSLSLFLTLFFPSFIAPLK